MAAVPRRSRAVALAAFAAVVAALLTAPAAHAISGGQPVAAGEFPFLAEVRNNAVGGLCTGTLVAPNWVLTATHCSVPRTPGDMTVRVGNTALASGGELRTINEIHTDPGYTGGHNDVALLHFATPITTVAPVKLAAPDISYRWDGAGGDTGIAIGWGQTVANGGASPTLQKTNVPIRPAVIDGAGIPMIPVGPGPCEGDSGGPLLVRNPQNELVEVGALKAAACGSGGDYSEVGAGPNRDWLLSRLGRYTPFGVADYDRDGKPDLIARDNTDHGLWLFPGQGTRGAPAARVAIGIDFSDYTPFGVADWDRNGTVDVIVRNDLTGDLSVFTGPGRRDWVGPSSKIGNGWGIFTPFGVADWDRDGNQDVVARNDASGDLMLYPGQSTLGYSQIQPVKIGNGWRTFTPSGLADWDRDGNQDVVARNNANGDLLLYPGQSVRAYSTVAPTRIGNGWAGFTSFGLGDWDRDANQDLLARNDPSGDLYLYPGISSRGPSTAATVRIGTGF